MTRAGLLAVVLVAASLRVWAIGGDLPDLCHPDEANHVSIAQRIVKSGDLNPHFFYYPSLFLYLNAIAYVPYYLVGRLTGALRTIDDIREPVTLTMAVGHTDMPSTVLLGRFVTLLFGTGAVVLAFLAGRALGGHPAIGLMAALLLAVSPTNVAYSRLITPDAFVVFFALATLLASARVLERGCARAYVAAGVAAGLTASSKYNGGLVLVAVLAAHWLRHRRLFMLDRNLHLALGAAVVAFLATTPFAVLDTREFLSDMWREVRHYSTGHAGMEGDTVRWYAGYLWSVEGAAGLLALGQLGYGLARRCPRTVLLGAFPLVYLAFIGRLPVRNDRTLMPALPFVFLLAALALASAWHGTRAVTRPPGLRPILAGAIVGVGLVAAWWPLSRTAGTVAQERGPDSRARARSWLVENVPAATKIALEPYAPFLGADRFVAHGFKHLIDHPLEWYVDHGYEVLVASERVFGRYYRDRHRYEAQVAQYDRLFQNLDLVGRFADARSEVRVYRVPTTGSGRGNPGGGRP